MSALVTTSFHSSWSEFVASRLLSFGVAEPISGEKFSLSPQQLTHKMAAGHGVALDRGEKLTQIPAGTAWQIPASDIFVTNAENLTWGWSDPLNVFFLDFWRQFDPECRFILVYGAASQSLAKEMEATDELTFDSDLHIKSWVSYHEAILKFYQTCPERCLLAPIDAFEGTASDITQKIQSFTKMPARKLNDSRFVHGSHILDLIAAEMVNDNYEQLSLFEEMEGISDLPVSNLDTVNNDRATNAFEEFVNSRKMREADHVKLGITDELQKQVEILLAKLESSERRIPALQHENSKLDGELKASRSLLDDALTDLASAEANNDAQRLEVERVSQAQPAEELTIEKDLLVQQLKQVHAELEFYFQEYQKLASIGETEPADQPKKPFSDEADVAPLLVDMTGIINGSGWHSSESQGRWAGDDPFSASINIPRLSVGEYQIRVEVADAISFEHFVNSQVDIDGIQISTKKTILSEMGGRLAPLRRFRATINGVSNPYPATITGQFSVTEQLPELASTLISFRYPRSKAPSLQGEADHRALSLCVSEIAISAV